MPLSEQDILKTLMNQRHRISTAAWVVVRGAHAAEDIFQNVALKALTKDVSFDAEGAVLSWAFVTARREGLDWLRKHRRESLGLDLDVVELMDAEWLPEAVNAGGGQMDALRECLENVPEQSQRLLRIRYFEGHSCENVAKHLGARLNAIYKRLSRLHEALKTCIETRMTATHPARALRRRRRPLQFGRSCSNDMSKAIRMQSKS